MTKPAVPGRSRAARVAVAVSGGMDSMSLLHCTAVACRASGIEVLALHVHHGLLEQADQWEDFVRRRCGQWAARGLPVALRSVRLKESPPHGASIEAWAKARRYAALAAMARDEGVDCVLLAQHRDDQAETVLLQGLRGGGPAGLAGMPACVEREGLWWLRPWLSHPRARIEAYARRHRLSWVEDPSNADMRLARARLRRTVLPALRAAFDGNDAAWCAVAARAREASLVLEEVARMDLATCSAQGAGLSVPRLLELSPARQANLLRCWLQGKCDRGVPQSLVDRLLHEVPASWLDAGVARWPLAEAWIQLYRGTLCVQPPARPGQALMLDLSRPGAHPLPGWSGRLEVRAVCTDEHRPGLAAGRLVSCVVRGRLPDDRFQLREASLPRALKKQFQANGVGPLSRHGPLVTSAEGQLLFVPGLGIDARVALFAGPRLFLRWHAGTEPPDSPIGGNPCSA